MVDLDAVAVGVPKFQWLLDRLDTAAFRAVDPDVYDALMAEFGSKERLVADIADRYAAFTDLPLLVEIHPGHDYRFNLLDGYHRMVALTHAGATQAYALFRHEGWGKQEWENGVLHALTVAKMRLGATIHVDIPQQSYLHGEAPFDLVLDGGPYEAPVEVDSFLISTGIRVPYIAVKGDGVACRGDDFTGSWSFRLEYLVGNGDHHAIMAAWGTQPFNSYLVGHFDHLNRRVMVQQYFRGGYWGADVPGAPYNGASTVREQIAQDEVGVPLLYDLGAIKRDTPVYYADQSADKPCALEDYFHLFTGWDSLRQYLAWLPGYLSTCRASHFTVPIAEVIAAIPEVTP